MEIKLEGCELKTNYNFCCFSVLRSVCGELHGTHHTKSTSSLLALITEHNKRHFLTFLNQKTALADSETEGEGGSMYRCR